MRATAFHDCPECSEQVGVTLHALGSRQPWSKDVQLDRVEVDDIPCGHVSEMRDWLKSPDGVEWCEAELEDARVTGALT